MQTVFQDMYLAFLQRLPASIASEANILQEFRMVRCIDLNGWVTVGCSALEY